MFNPIINLPVIVQEFLVRSDVSQGLSVRREVGSPGVIDELLVVLVKSPLITDVVSEIVKESPERRRSIFCVLVGVDVVSPRTFVTDILTGFQRFIDEQSVDRKSTRLNSSHMSESRMPSSA